MALRSTCAARGAACSRVQPQLAIVRHAPRVACRTASPEVAIEVPVSTIEHTPGKVLTFNAQAFDQVLEMSRETLVVVDVFTQWCGPCKMIAPELEKMAEEFGTKVVMSKIDCTSAPENKNWAKGQSVKALPTFIIFKDGKRVTDMTGAKAANLKKLIETHLA